MRVSIVTPSYNNSQWLKLCIASVADQGVTIEHIVQDCCSTDGTQDWLPHDTRVKAFIEKDSGMYNAVNRGLKRATGDILAYINCDEQYLPGALKKVVDYFASHPSVDVLFGDCVIVNDRGEYICSRKMQIPRAPHIAVSQLPTLTCGTFFRKSVIDRGFLFDTQWRIVGDAEWVLRLLKARVPMGLLQQFTSTFTQMSTNMSLAPKAQVEKQRLRQFAPAFARSFAPVIIAHYRLRRLLGGAYFQKPFEYSIYSNTSPRTRVTYQVNKPTAIWKIPAYAADAIA